MDKFSPPKIGVGDVAVWYKNRSAKPVPFAVSAVDARTISGNLLATTMHVSGLHHIDDPECRREGLLEEMETWDLSDSLKRLAVVEKTLGLNGAVAPKAAPVTAAQANEIEESDPEQDCRRLIGQGILDPKRLRESTGLHHKVVDKLLREMEALRTAARDSELVGSN